MATGRIPTTANSPLTVKGDLFGYSTTQARVPVGNDGETLVADSSTATGLRYGANFAAGKNKIINGDFSINQRGFTSSTTDLTYGFDRWQMFTFTGNGTTTYSAQTFTPGAAPVAGYEGTNFGRLVTTGQTGAGPYSFLAQKIEDVRTFAGQTITYSFWAKAATGTPKVAIVANQNFGTGGSPSAGVTTNGGTVTLSTSWARYSVSFAVPSISGKTIGTTANTSHLRLDFWVSSGTDYPQGQSIGIQSNTFDFWGAQAENGSTATAFQTATGTIQGELSACTRYYWRLSAADATVTNRFFAMGQANGTGQALITISNPVKMRGVPTASAGPNSNSFNLLNAGSAGIATTGFGTNALSADVQNMFFNVASGLTSGNATAVTANANNTAFIDFSAEL
jgi:hypothetical protein